MDTSLVRRCLVGAVVLSLLATTFGASVAAGLSDSGAPTPESSAVATGDGFAADTVGPSAPAAETRTTVTESGGSAFSVGTDDVFDNASSNITATQEFRLTPNDRGRITVVQRYRVPERVAALKPQLPAEVSVTGTTGFSQADGQTYEWDGNTTDPQITFVMDVNETRDLTGPEGARGRYLFVDAGDWALFRQPSIATSWSYQGGEPVGITRESTTAGPGYVGDWMVYMGEVETHERTAHGQRFQLIVPDRASLAESPDDILDTMATAADQLRVGDRDDEVYAFAAPTTTVEWGVRGLQYGDSDMWVRDAEALATAENTWLHEYVHTRQDYDTDASAKWTTEAFATYYAAHLAMEQGHANYDGFRDVIRQGTVRPQSDAVLTEPSSWANAANYLKGSLVAADTDRRIRLATDQSRSLQAVFSAMNAHQGPVNHRTVFESVGTVSSADVRQAAVTYARTERTPDLWTKAAHAEAFGPTPARIEVGFADGADRFAVGGPYRNASVEGSDLTVFTGETLTLTGAVSNTGGAASEYEARFAVDGRVRATETGTLQPGDRVTHSFERSFSEPGEHILAVGSDEVTVEVHDPVAASVTGLAANRTQLSEAGAVAFTATISNPTGVPARGNVTLRGPNGPIIDRQPALGPDENRTVSGVARLERGEYEFSVGDADTLTVTVGDVGGSDDGDGASQNGDDGAGGGSSGFGPGFGPVATLVGLLAGLALLGRRRQE
ncbi:PGF-CTERM sorting domain-containing protein [Halosimplex salinum]|uniref:PGF-CTERM sorting domain-containing protein n=1 Tax=Halosimplex salinum TaxID=1710538 RepID=UPI000F49165A|nr:PGF-CTERM sorting domain-containing protein [Halosimplex salinum]